MPINDTFPEDFFSAFRAELHAWYEANHRMLPWREVKNPYLIWISEVILQQTRVEQVLDYYKRFVTRFPTVADLAAADESEVLKLWQGLGYYSRARNLHASAKMIVRDFDGQFPTNYADVRRLKGIGDYTAAAICSFSYDMPYAVLDGNVFRFLARHFGVATPIDTTAGKREFSALADALLDSTKPALHNQAMMEMGALQCVTKNPNCAACPFYDTCVAVQNGTVEQLPQKLKKTKTRDRFFNYFLIKHSNGLFLKKRTERDVWRNLYEFPLVETSEKVAAEAILADENRQKLLGENFILKQVSHELKHVLSHQNIFARCFCIEVSQPTDFLLQKFDFVAIKDVENYPVSRLVEIFLNDYLVE